MAIRKKSVKEKAGEVRGFLDYSDNLGKISNAKRDEIFFILSENIDNIENKNDMKNCMSSVLSSDEFDELYADYLKYYGDAGKYIKDFFEKNKFFPEGYNFLISNLFRYLYDVSDYQADSLIKDLKGMSPDDISKWREYIKMNINIIKSVLHNDKDFRKLDRGLIFYNNPEEMKENITILQDCGINFDTVDDINSYANIITFGNYTRTAQNLHFLIEKLHIKDLKDLECLLELINFGDTEKIRTNIPALMEIGITNSEDLIKFKDVICNGSPDKIRSNIPILMKLGVTDYDKLSNLKYFINYGNGEILKELGEAGINIDDENIHMISDIVSHGIPGNITALKELGIELNITTIKENFGRVITSAIPENLIALKELGFHIDTNKLSWFDWFIMRGKLENLKYLKKLGIDINSEDVLNKNSYFITDGKLENISALKEFGIEIDSSNFPTFKQIIIQGRKENIQLLSDIGINKDSFDYFEHFRNILINGNTESLSMLKKIGIKFQSNDESLFTKFITESDARNMMVLADKGIFGNDGMENRERMKKLRNIIIYCNSANIEKILDCLEYKDNIEDVIYILDELKSIIRDANTENLGTILSFFPKNDKGKIYGKYLTDELLKYYNLLSINYGKLQDILSPTCDTKEDNRFGYLEYLQKIVCLKNTFGDIVELQKVMKSVLKLTFPEIDNYLNNLIDFCINKHLPYEEFVMCFDGKNIDKNLAKYSSQGFEIFGAETRDDLGILNNSVKSLFPNYDIKFNENEAQKILSFVNHIGGINKGYTILILIMEKMVRDGVSNNIFSKVLCNKLDNYTKIIDMFPEDKIPEGLKISVGMEIEMTGLFANRYHDTTGNNYNEVVNKITNDAKIGQGRDGIHEFATKPATNPLVALLEIHLLQELNLLDINDMQKLSRNISNVNCTCRNGTGYHLNIGSDSDIGIDDNVDFIQNLCTILPRSGISNGCNVGQINRFSNVNSKSSNFSVYDNPNSDKYIELRTYSVDVVELFEKNVLFNTYAIMGSQAQKKVTNINSNKIIELKYNDEINCPDKLMSYLDKNNLFKENQDIKSKKIAVEFMWMQLCILRIIDNYNQNFLDDELFGKDLMKNLNESRKNCFLDLLLSDKKETIGFVDAGHSSLIVKKYTNLKDNFDTQKYIQKNEPFTDEESKTILTDLGNTVDDKRIPYITTWLNKQLLWAKLCEGTTDTQELQDNINSKMSNIDRIKSYLRGNDQNIKIDREFLCSYFFENMSLIKFNPYHPINTDFVNKIVNLNNFFLKKDDTNAHGVLQYTKYNGKDETDISKLSIFQTGYMRKGYNYYQGGSEDMLIHSAQKIALSYMENVKNILNTDYDENNKTKKNGIKFNLAA